VEANLLIDTIASSFHAKLAPAIFRHLFSASLPRLAAGVVCLLTLAGFSGRPLMAQVEKTVTTAWHKDSFHIDRKGVIERSDVVLQKANVSPQAAMPLGNGRLGLGVWAENGYTAQLNRGDTFPWRLSPGWVVLPGLKQLTQASNYAGRLNLYDGEFEEQGGGMTATTYVDESLDVMAIDVTGANPHVEQTAELKLWEPRRPQMFQTDKIGILAETWLDDKEAGASSETFGSLAAITADALDLRVEKTGPLSIKITFRPRPDGSFRILVGAPTWRGGDAIVTATKLMTSADKLSAQDHRAWWNRFWEHPGLMKLSSSDGSAEYLENLRMIDIFTAAAESRDRLPGSQAGIGDLFSSIRDSHKWGPSAYWHWNLRMQVSANLGAGVFELNDSYFNLYRENLSNILDWTKKHMAGRAGACVPETVRFNGQGWENETWIPVPAMNCAQDFHPYYNARTISTGAEVSLWIWQQYLYTDDLNFLRKNYPVMRESARFLLAYGTHDAEGKFHTYPSNAHESKWDVHDPTTDVSAMRALFPAVAKAATLLKTDDALSAQLTKEIPMLPELPMVALSAPDILVASGDGRSDTVIAASYDPAAPNHNSENLGLEPVWPYGIIGDDGPLHAVAVRTYLKRPNKDDDDWSADPVQAAHLGLAEKFESSALALTKKYQTYPSGMASFMGPEFYVEQFGVLADALQSALVQDDGLIRIAPAWPKDWDGDGTVYILHGGKVHVQMRQGKVVTVGVETGAARKMRIRNPWSGQSVEIVDARTSHVVLPARSAAVLEFSAHVLSTYLVRPAGAGTNSLSFAAISGTRAMSPKSFGSNMIGIAR
jgi:alpha-L-fucosidase 2